MNPTVQDGQVVSLEYTLHVDGAVMDQSEAGEPLEFIQGEGQIIPGLEDALYGMAVGDSKQVVVAAEDGYGEVDADAYLDVPRPEFPGEIPAEVGTELQVRDQDGETLMARIDSVTDDTVRLDFNHPLAGKELHFDVKVLALRPATDEERSHGHVHGEGYEHEEEDEE